MDKISKRIKALYLRLRASDKTSNEYAVAQSLFDKLCKQYNINPLDFEIAISNSEPEQVIWNSGLTFNKLPQWFKIFVWIVSEALECKAIVGNGTAVLIGEKLKNCQEKLEHGIKRMQVTFDVQKPFVKDLHQASYNLGFAFGYRAAIEEKLAQELALDNATENAIIAIGQALTVANKYMVKLVEDATGNKPEQVTEIPKIKDQASFQLGWVNGFQAFKLLLTV